MSNLHPIFENIVRSFGLEPAEAAQTYEDLELRFNGPIPHHLIAGLAKGPRRVADLLFQATKASNDADRREAQADQYAAQGNADQAAFYLGVSKQERDRAVALRAEAAAMEAAEVGEIDAPMFQDAAE